RLFQKDRRQRQVHGELKQPKYQHGLAPTKARDAALEDRRPERARDVLPARNQRQRRPAPAVEPTTDIDVKRRIQSGDPQQTDEYAVTDIKRVDLAKPRMPERRDREPD